MAPFSRASAWIHALHSHPRLSGLQTHIHLRALWPCPPVGRSLGPVSPVSLQWVLVVPGQASAASVLKTSGTLARGSRKMAVTALWLGHVHDDRTPRKSRERMEGGSRYPALEGGTRRSPSRQAQGRQVSDWEPRQGLCCYSVVCGQQTLGPSPDPHSENLHLTKVPGDPYASHMAEALGSGRGTWLRLLFLRLWAQLGFPRGRGGRGWTSAPGLGPVGLCCVREENILDSRGPRLVSLCFQPSALGRHPVSRRILPSHDPLHLPGHQVQEGRRPGVIPIPWPVSSAPFWTLLRGPKAFQTCLFFL